MLVLTRKLNQQIRIGDNIVVRVLRVDPDGQVRLGIDAPKEVLVYREELFHERRRQASSKVSGLVAIALLLLCMTAAAPLRAAVTLTSVTGHVSAAQSVRFTNTVLTFTPDNGGPLTEPPLLISSVPVRATSTPPAGYFTIDLEHGQYVVQIGNNSRDTFRITIPQASETNHIEAYVTSGATTNFVAGDVSGWTKSASDNRYVQKINSWSSGQVLSNNPAFRGSTNAFQFTHGASPGYVMRTSDGTNWHAAPAPGGAGGLELNEGGNLELNE